MCFSNEETPAYTYFLKYEALTPWMGTLKGEMRDNQNFFKELFALCKTPGYESVKGRAEVLEKIFDVALIK